VSDRDSGLPLEQFIQALTSQLDRAQSTMALKARTGLPLTFAVKDISIDLRTHIDMAGSTVRIRAAGPGDADASVIHLALTTITRPMMEENTVQFEADKDEPAIKDVLGSTITDDEQKRLEWAGVHSLTQLRDLERQTGEQTLQRVLDIPVNRLRMALAKASQPFVTRISPESPPEGGSDSSPLLRVRGINLVQDRPPQIRVNGESLPVLQATNRSLLVAALPHQMGGTLSVETSPGVSHEKEFDLYPSPPPISALAAAAPADLEQATAVRAERNGAATA
jgi:hypothetical protein